MSNISAQFDLAGDVLSKNERIGLDIKTRILSGELAPSARLPTRLDMVDQYDVSSATVQKALNRLLLDGFIVAHGRLGSFVVDSPPHLCRYGLVFASNMTAQNEGRTHSTRFTEAMMQTALQLSDEDEHEIVLYTGIDHDVKDAAYERLAGDIRAHRLAGLIFMNVRLSYSPELLQDSGIPCIGRLGPDGYHEMQGFTLDLEAFITRALDHLAERGCKRIAQLTLSNTGVNLLEHFYAEAAARGLQTGPDYVIGLDPYNSRWARSAARMLLKQGPTERPDGLIISDDHLVSAAVQGVLESHVCVPDELDIVGHSNFTKTSQEEDLITHLGFDVQDIMRTCIKLLDDQRQGDAVPCLTRMGPIFDQERDNTMSAMAGTTQGRTSTR